MDNLISRTVSKVDIETLKQIPTRSPTELLKKVRPPLHSGACTYAAFGSRARARWVSQIVGWFDGNLTASK